MEWDKALPRYFIFNEKWNYVIGTYYENGKLAREKSPKIALSWNNVLYYVVKTVIGIELH